MSVPKTDRPSGAWTMPSGAMSHGFIPVMSTPSKRTAPAVTGISPETTRAVVDLPAPLAPSSATTCPSGIENDTPNSARNGP